MTTLVAQLEYSSCDAWSRKVYEKKDNGCQETLEPHCTLDASTRPHSSRSHMQVGVDNPPKPAAKSTNSPKIHTSTTPSSQTPHSAMESAPHNGPEPLATNQEDNCKLMIKILDAFLATLRSNYATKADLSLFGRIQGKHPGLRALPAWARDTLHPSLALLSLKANNMFEVTFKSPEGMIHALAQAELTCETTTISFSSWRPHFDSKAPHAEDRLDYHVWVQIVDLCQILREDTFLKTIGEKIGQAIAIDNLDAYRAKFFGPQVRLLIRDRNTLPHTAVLPRLDGEGVVEYTLEYSGLPNQYGRCRSREH